MSHRQTDGQIRKESKWKIQCEIFISVNNVIFIIALHALGRFNNCFNLYSF